MLSNKMLETNRPPLRSMLSTDSDVPSTVNLALLAAGAQLCVRAMLNTNATKGRMPELRATTTTGTSTVLPQAVVQEFKTSLRGPLHCPGDYDYEAARTVYNAMIDRRPALIARCAGAADIIACVQFARAQNLLVSVRSGGHGVAGSAICDGGLVIDLSSMRGMRVDPVAQTVRAEPGLTWGEFDRETQAFGLATTGGLFSPTGIAGLTLGGGLGWLHGLYGLACDNLLSADVVTADGRLLTASNNQNPDLFWGLRGGGGNFGIATSFEYRLHPVGSVLAGFLFYPIAKGPEVFRFYREYLPQLPDSCRVDIAVLTAPDGNLVVGVLPCCVGPVAEGERLVEPLRRLGPVVDTVRPMTYCELQTILDGILPPGRRNYWKSSFLPDLKDDAVERLIACGEATPSHTSFLTLEPIRGVASRVPVDATAFPHRGAHWSLLILGVWTDPAKDEEHIRWARESWEAMRPFAGGGVYVNYLGDEGDERIREAYGSNYDRLVALKTKYDPTNFWRRNQNVRPRVQS
jgi:FAD/FMN-containing dehydrogenase